MEQQEKGLFPRTGVRFEVACDVIGALIAHHGEAIADELGKPVPAEAAVAAAESAMAALRDERDALDPTDVVAVEDAIKKYAPMARSLYAR
jgi:hypothetical protein